MKAAGRLWLAALAAGTAGMGQAEVPRLAINERGYFHAQGVDVTVFADFYAEGHQTGVTVIQHGTRVAANGDLRLEVSPGQWSPIPASGAHAVDAAGGTISQAMRYPDPARDRKGFNPLVYPDLKLDYRVNVTALGDGGVRVSVDLDRPLPREWVGKVGFNFELFPGELFGKAWLMDGAAGIFPRQPTGPMEKRDGQDVAAALATGRTLIVAPDDELRRMEIQSRSGTLELIDGRGNHNNGWYIVRGVVKAGATRNALEWVIRPNAVAGWRAPPVIQVSQLGYAPDQPKRIVIEQDALDTQASPLTLYRLTPAGRTAVRTTTPRGWGKFLRYHMLVQDFTDVTEPGMYVVGYRDQMSQPFRIGSDIFSRHAWQPTLEYFLPAQMCHMRVNEKYRVWHGLDHQDDALMAPVNLNHFDGYLQGPSTLSRYAPLQPVPGLAAGGWHDAGDYDLRVESQMGTVWLLAKMVEEFGLDHDATTIDQGRKLVEIHQPDGKSDAIQQIEHGLLSVMGGYRSLGRLYRGIIEPTARQYVLLGDGSVQTDNLANRPVEGLGRFNNGLAVSADDRMVFTEDNPDREITAAAGLAAAARVLRPSNPALAAEALAAALALDRTSFARAKSIEGRTLILSELFQSTGDRGYAARLVALEGEILAKIADTGWALAPIIDRIGDRGFRRRIAAAVATYQAGLNRDAATNSPYGVPYKPDIWGAGWTIQEAGVKQYFFAKGWRQAGSEELYLNALNFVLGVHPGTNTASFVSGVGSKSATTAYGTNRADWSYIPGGVISGTALIRPDLPELKVWPYFWQQTEYVMGGGETNYMFLALAADRLYAKRGVRRANAAR